MLTIVHVHVITAATTLTSSLFVVEDVSLLLLEILIILDGLCTGLGEDGAQGLLEMSPPHTGAVHISSEGTESSLLAEGHHLQHTQATATSFHLCLTKYLGSREALGSGHQLFDSL